MIQRSARLMLGFILVVSGLIIMPMPIPFGLILIIIGLSVLISVLPQLKHQLRSLRQRYPKCSDQVQRTRRYLPQFARPLLDETDPEQKR